ncbi:MAG: HD domain-containing protein [Firmicutes bacterium]|nr:HD domain-containing protein [Bacillota bacterium]
MAKYIDDEEYLFIINNIIKNEKFKKIDNIKHHNTTRLDHSMKVSYYSYKIAKSLKLDYRDVARGGLLHDFYTDKISECNKIKDKIKLFSTQHPKDAVNNAITYFDLSEKEINIIETHMFPVDYRIPKYAESWIVSLVDKVLSFGEFSKKFSYKFSYILNLYLLFILNIIK